jgi:hypothetical protein
MITPALDEEAIVKMSDENLQYYGTLVRDHCLQDVYTSFEGTKINEYNENDEMSIRQFCASRVTKDPLGGTNCCIGEFVSGTGDDILLRRYYILIVFGDFGLFDEAVLIQYEWKVGSESVTKTVDRKKLMSKELKDVKSCVSRTYDEVAQELELNDAGDTNRFKFVAYR